MRSRTGWLSARSPAEFGVVDERFMPAHYNRIDALQMVFVISALEQLDRLTVPMNSATSRAFEFERAMGSGSAQLSPS